MHSAASNGAARDIAPEKRTYRSRDELRYQRLAQRADRKRASGNVARAAILHTRAAHFASPKRADQARGDARAEIETLVNRLAEALSLDNDDAQRWGSALRALLEGCRGAWPVEARLLYDLQKVCVDFEREIFTVDLPEWLFSLGRRPVRRSLPMVREVLMCKHLRSATKRLPAVRISETYRSKLAELLKSATHRAEESCASACGLRS